MPGVIPTAPGDGNVEGKARYRIKVRGRLDGNWATWFEGVLIAHETAQDGSTLTSLESGAIDQAELHGMLVRLRNLNLTLVSIESFEYETK